MCTPLSIQIHHPATGGCILDLLRIDSQSKYMLKYIQIVRELRHGILQYLCLTNNAFCGVRCLNAQKWEMSNISRNNQFDQIAIVTYR